MFQSTLEMYELMSYVGIIDNLQNAFRGTCVILKKVIPCLTLNNYSHLIL